MSQRPAPDQNFTVIGERINAASSPKIRRALERRDEVFILEEARGQLRQGAGAIDVQAGTGDGEAARMRGLARLLGTLNCPLVLDSARPEVLEAAVEFARPGDILNSVNGEEENLGRLVPLARTHGLGLIGLTLDGKGIPKDRHERLRIAEKIVDRARREGVSENALLIDPVLLPLRYYPGALAETLAAVRMIKKHLGVATLLGLSNGSFGLGRRREVNRRVLALALDAGLDRAILDPADAGLWSLIEERPHFAEEESEAYRLEQELHETHG